MTQAAARPLGTSAASSAELATEKLGKTFGTHRALVDVSVRFAPGRVTGILGPNGAGKSTLLGILATLVRPTSGRVLWGKEPLGTQSPLRAQIGYVGHDPGLYADLDARANLAFFETIYGLPKDDGRIEALLGRVGLADARKDAPVRTFSRGMQQRLALARALLHQPPVLLFDEPGSALDPAGAAWLGEQLGAERDAGRTVVLVTHDLDAAAGVVDRVLVLRRGRVARDEERAGGFSAEALRTLYREATDARA